MDVKHCLALAEKITLLSSMLVQFIVLALLFITSFVKYITHFTLEV